jgi:hypothetical protein
MIVFGSLIFVIVALIVARVIYRKWNDRSEVYPDEDRSRSRDAISAIILIDGWFDGTGEVLQEDCQITYEDLHLRPFVKTYCTHCFYIAAFANWAQRSSRCACCRRDMRGKTHKVFCPCGCRKYREATTEDIVASELAGRTTELNTYP